MLERLWRKGNPLALLVGMLFDTATMENSMEVPEKIKIELPYGPAIPLLGTYSEKTIIQRDKCTSVFTAALTRTWKQPTYVSIDRWMDKAMIHVNTMESYSALNKISSFAVMWMDLESVIQSEANHKNKYGMHVKLIQSCPSVCDPVDCSPPGSSVHGILQARILEWVTMPLSRGSSWPRGWTYISFVSCDGRQILYH